MAGASRLAANRLGAVAALVLFASQVVGGFSLSRLGVDAGHFGVLGEARFVLAWLSFCLAILMWPGRAGQPVLRTPTLFWLGSVGALHLLVVTSWLWSDQTSFSGYQVYEIGLLLTVLASAALIFGSEPFDVLRIWMAAYLVSSVGFVTIGLLLSGAVAGDLAVLGAGGIGSARLLGGAVLLLVYLYFRSGLLRWLALTPMLLLGVMASGSRAALVAMAAGLAVIWLRRKDLGKGGRPLGARQLTAALGWCVVVCAALLVMPATRRVIIDFLLSNLVFDDASRGGATLYLAARDTIFTSAWNHFRENFFTGSGVGTYTGPFGEQYPHNLMLNFAVDTGILGVAGLLLMLGWAGYRVLRCQTPLVVLAGALALFFLVCCIFAGTYYDARLVWLFLLVGLLCRDRVTS